MWTGFVTEGGRALFAEWASGKKFTITRAEAGVGRRDVTELRESSGLIAKKQDISIAGIVKKGAGVEVNLRFTAADESYFASEIGVWAKLDDGAETMIAIYQNTGNSPGIEIPNKKQVTDFVYTFYAVITAASNVEFQAVIDAATLATKGDIEAASKEVRPVKYGGTGADNGPAALKILGAVNKGGDTMTGTLIVPSFVINNGTNTTPTLALKNDKLKGSNAKVVYDAYRGQLYFQADYDGNGYYEQYSLPYYSGNRKEIAKFDILTTKKAVSIGQGGTGETTAAAARTALGITPENIGALKNNGDNITGWLTFNGNTIGLKWTTSNGTVFGLRPYTAGNLFQITTQGPNTSNTEHASFTICHDGKITFGKALGIESGGTGATTAAAARTALGITPANIGAAASTHGHALTDNGISGVLGIEKGGTGAITAAAARKALGITPANIGALSISGGVMTGTLRTPYIEVLKDNKWPLISFGDSTTGKTYGGLYQDLNTNQFGLSEIAANSQYAENYRFPKPDVVTNPNGMWYHILTSKKAVEISQGGTGANNKSDARKNLGLEIIVGTSSGSTSSTRITFSKAFTGTPVVTATPTRSDAIVCVKTVTSTYFEFACSTGCDVYWQAIFIN